MIYFAWSGPDEAFGPEHQVQDEKPTRLEVTQTEDDFPSARVTIRNPKIGLLNPARQIWAWISETDDSTDGVTAHFFGQLVAIPEDMQAETVVLAFTARPADYEEQKQAVAAPLKVAPYWDPIWINEDRRDDPDTILETRPQLWHVDRVTHEVSLTDIITGEDGTIVFSADDHFYEDVRCTYGQAPVRRVHMEAEVSWRQAAMGSVDITENLIAAFATAGSTVAHHITSFTGEGLMDDWPEKGDRIGGGWEMGETSVVRKDGIVVDQEYETVVMLDGKLADFPRFTMRAEMEVDYDVERSYSEKVVFDLEADLQSVFTEPGDEETIRLSLASSDVGEPVDPADTDNPDGALPIGDLSRRSYFQTDRGKQSLEYLIAYCRAHLLARARTFEISFATNRAAGVQMSCRKNAQVFDSRIPGGQAAGKIIGYSMVIDGDSGENICRVTMGCTVGQGNTVAVVAGTPSYVEEGYVDAGYQFYTGSTVMPIAGEVTYADFAQEPDDDGIDFNDLRAEDIIDSLVVINGEAAQRAILRTYLTAPSLSFVSPDVRAAAAAVNEVFTEVDLELVPLNTGPFETTYNITLSDLMVPKTIDLEAAAVS